MAWTDNVELEMAILQEVRDTVDAWLAARWPTLQARQTAYASNHNGRYFQGLPTHGSIPADGTETLADRLNLHPTDQAENWLDAIPTVPTQWPCMMRMNVYNGPQGWGYVGSIYVYVASLDRIYSRSQNVGPENWRTEAWHQVTQF